MPTISAARASPFKTGYGEELQWTEAFRPRVRLARLALLDYAERRYHACIPVVLAMLDGYVNDLGMKGFHAHDVDLGAWDSIVGHDRGLKRLHEVLNKTGRQRTRTERITVPYRNGILHGMDLGYDNRIVAAKVWGALAAVSEWGIKVQRGEHIEPPPKPDISIADLWKQLMNDHQTQRRLEEWKPRDLVVGRDVSPFGSETQYKERSPERALVRLLAAWTKRKYGIMAEFAWRYSRERLNTVAGELRRVFDDTALKSFELLRVVDNAPAVTHVTVRARGEVTRRGEFDCELEFRLVLEGAGGFAINGDEGMWTVPALLNTVSVIRATFPEDDYSAEK